MQLEEKENLILLELGDRSEKVCVINLFGLILKVTGDIALFSIIFLSAN
jgi:hypothetical protein